jgi:hypothetical protein
MEDSARIIHNEKLVIAKKSLSFDCQSLTSQKMRNFIPTAFVIFFFCSLVNAQENYEKLPVAKRGLPFVMLNDSILVSFQDLGDIQGDDVKKVEVYRPINNLAQLKRELRNLTEHGLILINTEPIVLPRKLLAKLLEEQQLPQNANVYIDGYRMEDLNYSVASASIKAVEMILPTTENKLNAAALNVWTLERPDRETEIGNCCCIRFSSDPNIKPKQPAFKIRPSWEAFFPEPNTLKHQEVAI